MSIFNLEKREQSVRFVLEKRAIKKAPVMRVGAALDVSGSAKSMYLSGVIQETLNRLVPIALKFDDNGELDLWTFDNSPRQLETVSRHNYEVYVKENILNSSYGKWGGTQYAELLSDMMGFYFPRQKPGNSVTGLLGSLFGKKPAEQTLESKRVPAMGLLITDGANRDRAATAKVLRASSDVPVYWQMVGVGDPSEFGFLREMADELDNVGFVHLSSLELSDDTLYDALLSEELCTWIAKH